MIEKILKEINRLKKELDGYSASEALDYIESYINTLPEEHNDDLEEEIQRAYYDKSLYDADNLDRQDFNNIAHHFAEWQKMQMKETLQTEYEKGRFDIREEMMKDAVNGTVCHRNGNVGDIYFQSDSVLSAKYPFKYGERIKIIIVKTEQQ